MVADRQAGRQEAGEKQAGGKKVGNPYLGGEIPDRTKAEAYIIKQERENERKEKEQ